MSMNQQDKNFHLERDRRILIVDDEPYNLMGLSIMIQQTAIKCFPKFPLFRAVGDRVPDSMFKCTLSNSLIHKAHNGLDAYNSVKQACLRGQYSYGLIFMDCSMPVLDGYGATEKIRSFYKKRGLT